MSRLKFALLLGTPPFTAIQVVSLIQAWPTIHCAEEWNYMISGTWRSIFRVLFIITCHYLTSIISWHVMELDQYSNCSSCSYYLYIGLNCSFSTDKAITHQILNLLDENVHPRTSLSGHDVPADDVPVEDIPSKDVPVWTLWPRQEHAQQRRPWWARPRNEHNICTGTSSTVTSSVGN